MKQLIVSMLLLYSISTSSAYSETPPLPPSPKEEMQLSVNHKTEEDKHLISHAVISQLKKKNSIRKLDINKKNKINHKEQFVKLGTTVTSEKVLLTNIQKKTFLRVGKGFYKINNKEWNNKKIEIKNNDSIILKHTSSLFEKGETTTNIYINDILKFTFTSITP